MKVIRRARALFLLNKNMDLVSSQVAAQVLRFDCARYYVVLVTVRWAVQCVLGLGVLHLVAHGISRGAGLFLSIVGVIGVALGPVFEDSAKTLKRLKADYVARLSDDPGRSRSSTLSSVYWFWMLRNLGAIGASLAFMALEGEPRAFAISWVVVLATYVLFVSRSLFKARVNAVSGMVAYLMTGGIVCLLSAWVCSAINAVLAEAGRAYSLGQEEVLGRRLPDVMFSDLLRSLEAVYRGEHLGAMLAVLCLILLGAALLVRRSRLGSLADRGYQSEYIRLLGARNRGSEGFGDAIWNQLSRQVPRFGATELSFLVPFETWLLLGVNLSLLPKIEHPGAMLVMMAIQVHVLMMASHRAVVSHYPEIFELGNLLGMLRLFRRLPRRVRARYYRDLGGVLKAVVRLPNLILAGTVLGVFSGIVWARWGLWAAVAVLMLGALQGLALWFFLVRVCLGAPVDAFEVVLKRIATLRGDDLISDLASFVGYKSLRNLRMVPLFVVQTVIVFVVLLLPVVGVVSGVWWWVVGVAIWFALMTGAGLATRKYQGRVG